MSIIFKDVKGYEDFYSVSDSGIVFSKRFNKIIKHEINKNNKIHSVRLSDENNVIKRQSVARLMAIAFIKNPNPTLYNKAININGNHDDLRVNNIMWGTSFIQNSRKNKRYPKLNKNFIASGVKINTRKMDDKLVDDLFKMRDLGYSTNQLSDIFPIKKSQIFNILKTRKI